MADITQLRFAQLLKAVLGLKAIDPARATTGTLAAAFEVQDQYRPELRLSRGEVAWGGAQHVNNTAATNFGQINISNPQNSGRLCVIEEIRLTGNVISANQGGVVFLVAQRLIGGGTPTAFFAPRDFRTNSNQVPVTGFLAQTTTAAVTFPTASPVVLEVASQTSGNAQVNLAVRCDIAIPPGQGLIAWMGSTILPAVTYGVTISFQGYERGAEPAELAGVFPP